MKVYLYYKPDSPNDFVIVAAENILKADDKVKLVGLNPITLACTNLYIGVSKMVAEYKVFAFQKRDSEGNLVIDADGFTEYIREERLVNVTKFDRILIQTVEELTEFVKHVSELYQKYDTVSIDSTPNHKFVFLKDKLIGFLSNVLSTQRVEL